MSTVHMTRKMGRKQFKAIIAAEKKKRPLYRTYCGMPTEEVEASVIFVEEVTCEKCLNRYRRNQ